MFQGKKQYPFEGRVQMSVRIAVAVVAIFLLDATSASAKHRCCTVRHRGCQQVVCCPQICCIPSCGAPTVGCSAEGAASLRNVRIRGQSIKGEAWGRIKVKCAGVTLIDFD